MKKIINFLKTNYFVKGLICFVVFAIIDLAFSPYGRVSSGLPPKSDILLFDGLKGIFAITSLVFFVFSTIKENKKRLILKIISACFVPLLTFWAIDKIIFLIKRWV